MAEIKILIADSQRLFSHALSIALSLQPEFRPMESRPEAGWDAIDASVELHPDVVLLDYWMPDIEGPAAVQMMLSKSSTLKVLLLSWFHGARQIQQGIAAGAVGFIPKSSDVGQVAEAVRRAAEGESPVFAKELSRLVGDLNVRYDSNLLLSNRFTQLTARELAVLKVLRLGLSIEDLAGRLFLSPKTVKRHINSILRKTGTNSQSEVLGMARSCGLLRT